MKRINGLFVLTLAIAAGGIVYERKRHPKTPFDEAFDREAKQRNIDPDMLRGIARTENDALNPFAVSPPNANGTRDLGLMQINEKTAPLLGLGHDELFDPDKAIRGAAQLLDSIRKELAARFNPYTWVAAYNAGSPHVIRYGITNMAYVGRVFYHWQMYKLANA